jgi:two-component system NtrC family sensor kinase
LHLALQYQNQVLEERVQQRTRQLLQMEKLSAMGQLLAGVAHELNNPLAVVSGQAQLLQAAIRSGPLVARTEKIVKAADRCVRIVKNFLALARERPPERAAVDVNTVVREAAELLSYELRTDSIEVTLELADRLPRLWADPHQLHQVVVNLVANAHHAMRKMPLPRTLTVVTRMADTRSAVRLSVSDSGPGIPAEILGRIFDPFFTTKPPGQGTGLGLSLSHGIIEDHGGTIEVESQPGQGTTFVIDLPVAMAAPSASAAAPDQTAAPLGPQRILVVDDEADVAGVLVDLLQSDGHVVDTALNGAEALAKIQAGVYDVILTDTKMPVLDGVEFFEELERRHPQLRQRVAFVTGDVLNADKRAFLDRTGAPTLAKPFDLAEIRHVVRRLVHGEPPKTR